MRLFTTYRNVSETTRWFAWYPVEACDTKGNFHLVWLEYVQRTRLGEVTSYNQEAAQ
jgi:hypothetical protein